MPLWVVNLWAKVQTYVAIAAAVVVAFAAAYWSGRRDARRQNQLEGMRDNERTQRTSNEVRRDIDSRSDADVAGRLRPWTRD